MSSADALTCLAFSPDSQKVASGTARSGVTITHVDSEIRHQLKTATHTPVTLAWSPDGGTIMSALLDNTLHCYDAVSSNSIGPPFQGHKELIIAASFLHDSSHAISLSRDGQLLLWDIVSGAITQEATVSKDSQTIFVAALSVDGTLLITGDRKECVAWEIPGCGKIADIALPDIPLLQAAIIPNSRQVVLVFGDMSFRIWDTKTGDYDSARFDGLGVGEMLCAVAVSPSGGLVAIEIDGVNNYPTRFYDRKGQKYLNSNIKCIHPFAFSPDGKMFAASRVRSDSKDSFHTLVIYPVEKITGSKTLDILTTSALGNRKKQRTLSRGFFDEPPRGFDSAEGASASRGRGVGPSSNIAGQQVSPQTTGKRRLLWRRRSTGRETASGPSTRKRRSLPLSRMWKGIRHPRAHKVGSPEQANELQGCRPSAVDVPVAKGTRRNISAAQVRNEREKAKNAAKGKARLSQSSAVQQYVGTATASPSSKFDVDVPTSSITRTTSFAAAGLKTTQSIKPHQKFKGHTDRIMSVIHLTKSQRMMTCSLDGSLREWNLETGEQIGNNWRDGENKLYVAALSPDGQKIVCGGGNNVIKIWDIDTAKVIAKWTRHGGDITSVCWNRDGGRVMSGSRDGTAMVWDAESGKIIQEIKTGHQTMNSAIYSPDETIIASGGYSEEKEFLTVWDANTGKLVAKLAGHTNTVKCLSWTARSTLISGSEDHSIRTWNTTNWEQIKVFSEHADAVFAIEISPNGRILASASRDNTARLWNLENGQPIGSPLQHAGISSCVSFSTDGKILTTGCYDNNAYSWDIDAIIREAGLDELINSNNCNKSFLDSKVDPTRRLGWRREHDNARLPQHSFDGSPRHSRLSGSLETIPRAGRWTRFRLFICCLSIQTVEGYH